MAIVPAITLQCPNCPDRTQENLARSNLDRKIRCTACGHTGDLEQFVDADTRARILDYAAKAVIDAFKNVPGFKPSR